MQRCEKNLTGSYRSVDGSVYFLIADGDGTELSEKPSDGFTAVRELVVSDTVRRIRKGTLTECRQLKRVSFAGTDTVPEEGCLPENESIVIAAPAGSRAEDFAREHGYPFLARTMAPWISAEETPEKRFERLLTACKKDAMKTVAAGLWRTEETANPSTARFLARCKKDSGNAVLLLSNTETGIRFLVLSAEEEPGNRVMPDGRLLADVYSEADCPEASVLLNFAYTEEGRWKELQREEAVAEAMCRLAWEDIRKQQNDERNERQETKRRLERERILRLTDYDETVIDPERMKRSAELRVTQQGETRFLVTGQNRSHIVTGEGKRYICDCTDFLKCPKNCKHILRVRVWIGELPEQS